MASEYECYVDCIWAQCSARYKTICTKIALSLIHKLLQWLQLTDKHPTTHSWRPNNHCFSISISVIKQKLHIANGAGIEVQEWGHLALKCCRATWPLPYVDPPGRQSSWQYSRPALKDNVTIVSWGIYWNAEMIEREGGGGGGGGGGGAI